MSRNRFLFIIGTVVALIILTVVLGRHDVPPATIAASMLATTLRFATPITLGALAGLFCERSGVVNIAIEGMMLAAAFGAWLAAALTQNLGVGIAAAIAGLGGAYFTLEAVPSFETLITNGRGFIALAAMIFGGWTPFGAWAAALLFGAANALQINAQQFGVPISSQIIGMFPYLLTIIVLAGVIGRAVPPAADGVPYETE